MRPRSFLPIICLCLAGISPSGLAQQSRPTIESNEPSDPSLDLRVGLISYDKPEDKIRDYRALFEELSKQEEATINYKPRFAVGTYADVLDWITRGLVDIAVLSPNAFAETNAWKTESPGTKVERDCIYLATEGKAPPAADAWVNETLKRSNEPEKGRFEYNSVCITSADSGIRNFDDLKKVAHDVHFIFGDPLSASGTILPMHFLRARGIDFRKSMEYSFGHSDSVSMIQENSGSPRRNKVAFVQDLAVLDTQQNRPVDKRANLVLVQETGAIKGLNDELLPMEVWVARKDFDKGTEKEKKSKQFRAALLAHFARKRWSAEEEFADRHSEKPRGRMEVEPKIRDFTNHDGVTLTNRIEPLHRWAQEIRGLLAQPESAPLDGDYSKHAAINTPGMKFPIRFQDILSLIRHHNKIYKTPQKKARLALVLSGGGAKCAYQSGAVVEIEETLRTLQGQNPGDAIDIDLVVGTSGGALNAIPIAAGVTADANTEPKLKDTWKKLNALEIIQPPPQVQILFGIAFAFLYFFFLRFILGLLGSVWWKGLLIWMLPLAAFTLITRVVSLPFMVGYVFCYLLALLLVNGLLRRWSFFSDEWRILIVLLTLPVVLVVFYLLTGGIVGRLLVYPSHAIFYPLLLGSWLEWGAILSFVFALLVLWSNLTPASAMPSRASWLRNAAGRLSSFPIGGLLALAGLWFVVTLFFASSNRGGFFEGPPLEEVVTDRYAEIFADPNDKQATTGEFDRRRERISSLIFERPQRRRDLVITGSSLTAESRGPKYFYLPRPENLRPNTYQPPSYGTRGIEIGTECAPNRLVDVALGSGTIFPVFPSHQVTDPSGNPKKVMHLIDGGFAHNTPVEAAVLWGATHIILIGASPETTSQGEADDPVLLKVMTAFGFLYDQAQIADVNAQEEAAVFTLHPKPPSEGPRIGIIDFGPGFAKTAFDRGQNDGRQRSFVRQPAKPLFWEAEAAAKR